VINTQKNRPPIFPVARLYRKTSENGNFYFDGCWGGARVLVLKSPELAEDGSEMWGLVLAKAPSPKPLEKTVATEVADRHTRRPPD
jgi:hypothetical protein